MSKLSIIRKGGYSYNNDSIFEYERKSYMYSTGTNIKVSPYGTIILTIDHGFRKNKEGIYDPEITEGRYETKEIRIDDPYIEKIKNIINDNILTISTMGGLEGGRHIKDGRYSYIFLGNEDTNIQAIISNLWQFQKELPIGENNYSDPFCVFDDKKGEYIIAENLTKLMNVFFKIKNVLVENGIDEEYFGY